MAAVGRGQHALGAMIGMAGHMPKPNACDAMRPMEENGVACDCQYVGCRIARPAGCPACWVLVLLVHHACLVPVFPLAKASVILDG